MSSSELFEDIITNLHSSVHQSLTKEGYVSATGIQSKVMPIILAGRDVMASAETGSGKTLAFVLPIVQKLLNNPLADPHQGNGPRVLILSPTRELATQIMETISKVAKLTSLRWGSITGGVPYFSQIAMLRKPFDFLVATPGRLMDHMREGRVNFSRLEFFVLDEADRMLDMGFIDDMRRIAEETPSTRQTLLFSATLEGKVQTIARQFLKNPERVQMASVTDNHALISQVIYYADDLSHKRALLMRILEDPTVWQAIVFISTKRAADRLAEDLSIREISCEALHGDLKQSQRTRVLDKLKRGKIRVVVATDVAARGIDVKDLTHVINIDLPRELDGYIHRIGRTGRNGKTGVAISFIGPEDRPQLARIQHFIGKKLDIQTLEGLEPKRTADKPARPRSFGTPKRSFGGNNNNGRQKRLGTGRQAQRG
jgi:superfamily II DNA/RNA helicase